MFKRRVLIPLLPSLILPNNGSGTVERKSPSPVNNHLQHIIIRPDRGVKEAEKLHGFPFGVGGAFLPLGLVISELMCYLGPKVKLAEFFWQSLLILLIGQSLIWWEVGVGELPVFFFQN